MPARKRVEQPPLSETALAVERHLAEHLKGFLAAQAPIIADQVVELYQQAQKLAKAAGPLQRTIAVDFDGVLHNQPEAISDPTDIAGAPIQVKSGPSPFEALQTYIEAGWRVVVFTARMSGPPVDPPEVSAAISQWFVDNGFPIHLTMALEITAVKPRAAIYLDDRGWNFAGEFPSVEQLAEFKPWWEKS